MFHSIPCPARLQWLNHPLVEEILGMVLRPPQRGRKGYDKVQMFKWLLWKQLTGWSYRDLESMTGVDYTTFIKFRKRLSVTRWFGNAFTALSGILATSLGDITVLLDSSFVETYSGHDERGSEYNGYKERNGFKLHQIIDFETRLPLLQRATPGARADIVVAANLIRGAPRAWNVSALVADKGYDGANFAKMIKRHWNGVAVAIPLRRHKPESRRWVRIKAAERTLDRRLFNKRSEIERYFSRVKRVWKLGEERTRGLHNFETNAYLVSIGVILEFLTTPKIWVQLFTMLRVT